MIKISKLTAFFLLFSTSFNFYSQNKTIDSLKTILANPKIHDTTRLFTIATLIDQFSFHDKNNEYWNSKMGKLAYENYKLNNTPELHKQHTMYLAAYYNNLAVKNDEDRNIEKAKLYYDKSIALHKSVKAYNEMSYAMVSKGVLLASINNFDEAIKCYFSALKFFETNKKENVDGISYVYVNLGALYSNQKKYEKSIEYNKKAIYYLDYKTTPISVEDQYMKSSMLANLGSSYFLLIQYPEALSYFEKALILSKKIKENTVTSIILSKIGRIKTEQLEFLEAEKLFKEALKTSDELVPTANANVRLGEMYFKKKEYSQADFYLTKGFELSKSCQNLELQEQASELLFQTNKETRNFKKSVEMLQFYNKLIDSSKVESSKNELVQQQLKYDYEKKALNYKLETQKKNAIKENWLIILSSVLLLLLVGSYFYYRNNRQKQAISTLEKNQIKQKLLITQMNPHFIFNSIDNIQSLIHNKQDNDAINYLTKFSKLTRQILENSNENYILLSEEIEMTENYLIIQQLLHANKFDFKIIIDNLINTQNILLPPMLTQPFIENAIKHGLQNKTENGMINISFYMQDAKLFFQVTDNGNGFNVDKKTNNHKSLAMTITKERLINYSKNRDFNVQTDNLIDNDENVVGAKVIFEIPYIYEN